MAELKSLKRSQLIRYLSELEFEGPYSGKKHQFMVKGNITVRIPNPHQSDVGKDLLRRILRQAKIDRSTWRKL